MNMLRVFLVLLLLAGSTCAQTPPAPAQGSSHALLGGIYQISPVTPPPAPVLYCYDAEAHIGLVADDPTPAIARQNARRLTAALNAQWSGGKFQFIDGTTGPVLRPICCAAKEFFFAGPINTSTRIGGALLGFPSRSYIMSSDHYGPGGTLGGAVTRFTDTDAGDLIVLRGAGFTLANFDLKGRPWPTAAGPTGTPSDALVVIEGRSDNSSGKHSLRQLALNDARFGIRVLPGYYDRDGQLVPLGDGRGAHGDETVCEQLNTANLASVFRCENEQAIGWSFRDVTVGGSKAFQPIVFDLERGGALRADNVLLNQPTITLLRAGNYSGNTARIVIENIWWDNFNEPTDYCRLFFYDGPAIDMSWAAGFDLRFSGSFGRDPRTWDTAKLVTIAAGVTGLNTSRHKFDVTNLPEQR